MSKRIKFAAHKYVEGLQKINSEHVYQIFLCKGVVIQRMPEYLCFDGAETNTLATFIVT